MSAASKACQQLVKHTLSRGPNRRSPTSYMQQSILAPSKASQELVARNARTHNHPTGVHRHPLYSKACCAAMNACQQLVTHASSWQRTHSPQELHGRFSCPGNQVRRCFLVEDRRAFVSLNPRVAPDQQLDNEIFFLCNFNFVSRS
jgi:hypothetical protein